MAKERRKPELSLFIGQMGKSLYENSWHRVSGIARKRQRVFVVVVFLCKAIWKKNRRGDVKGLSEERK